jgi:CRP/FNR family transcriptional regulator
MQVQANLSAAKLDFGSLAVCRGLGHQSASRFAEISSLNRKVSGETIFSEGDASDYIYEVVHGTLRLYRLLSDGRRQIMGFPTEGHILGLAPDGTHAYTAEAITDVTLCRYPRTSFDRLVDSVPGLARRLWTVTSDELRYAQDLMLLLGRKTATEKVASFLLLMAEQQPDADDEVAVPMTRSDIGDYLGLTVETVSRTLTKLKRDRLIALPTLDRIEFLDRDRLEEVSAGELAACA